MVVGEPGTGKSWLAVKVAEDLDPTFTTETMKDRCVFKAEDFTNTVALGKLKRGNAVILDEAGTAIDSHRWFTFNNRAIKYIFETFRQDNLIVIFTVPIIDFIDANVRKLFKFYMETEDVFRKDRVVRVKVRHLKYNQLYKKLLNPMPIYRMPDGRIMKFNKFYIKKADVKLIREYEKLSRPFKVELKEDLHRELSRRKTYEDERVGGLRSRRMTDEDIVKKILADKKRYMKKHGTRVICNAALIRYDFKVGDIRSKGIKVNVENSMGGGE